MILVDFFLIVMIDNHRIVISTVAHILNMGKAATEETNLNIWFKVYRNANSLRDKKK
jgi:hypothetical protein